MLKWALSSGAFAAVIGTAGGCAKSLDLSAINFMGSDDLQSEPAEPVTLAQNDIDALDDPDSLVAAEVVALTPEAPVEPTDDPFEYRARTAPEINIFGELDGKSHGPVKTIAEANFQQHTFLDEGYDAEVAVDPAGKYLVFTSTRHSENSDIYLQRVDGKAVTQLTSDSSDDAYPVFSPNGKSIAFCSTRAGSWDIYTMDSDGRNVVQITSGPLQDLHPSFSPDGSKLVYCSAGGRSGHWELWTVDLLKLERTMIGFGLFPRWSPDNSADRIAFQRARQRGGRWFSLWTLDLVDGEARRVTEVTVSTNAAIISPCWSPDGKRLAFSTITEPTRFVDGKPLGHQDIWVVNADGTNRQRITDGSGMNLSPFWSVDNRVYFVSDRGGTEAIWSARAQGGAPMLAGSEPAESTKSAAVDSHEVTH